MSIFSSLINHTSFRLLTSLLALAAVSPAAHATPCVAFDIDFNLYAFGFGGKDFQLGTQDKWASTVNPTDITSTGRPPFNGQQTTCYLAQFFNAIYVLDGDTANPTAVHIYNVATKSWSTQAVNPGGPDPSSLVAILDHDTNFFYALDNGKMSSLDLGSQTSANSTALTWNDVGNPPFDTTGYKPTMALAENHIHFIGVPNSQPGAADIFVIHFSFFQPVPQEYNAESGGNTFPSTHGQTTSFFKDTGVQKEFAFIPDDGSATYVVNVDTNTTLPLAGPTDKSPSTFAASINALVQLTSTGSLAFLPYTPDNPGQSQAATWSKIDVQGLPAVTSSSGSGSGNTTSGSGGAKGSGTGTTSGAGPSETGAGKGNNGKDSGALTVTVGAGVMSMAGTVLALSLVLL